MPKRVDQHVSESESFKLFLAKMPLNWIVRQVTERDYGIDCYVEIVDPSGDLTGHMFLCQLKSTEEITWAAKDEYTLYDVKISTTNYWFQFQVPVFLFLADIKCQELYSFLLGTTSGEIMTSIRNRKNLDMYSVKN